MLKKSHTKRLIFVQTDSTIIGLLSGISALVVICVYIMARRWHSMHAGAKDDGLIVYSPNLIWNILQVWSLLFEFFSFTSKKEYYCNLDPWSMVFRLIF